MEQEAHLRDKLISVCRQFRFPGEVLDFRMLPGGQINTTCAVTLSDGTQTGAFLVQRVNPAVFPDPVGLMRNIDRVTEHIIAKEGAEGSKGLCYYHTASGENYVILGEREAAELWRVCDYIENTVTFESGEGDARILNGAGRGFGRFLRQLRDFDPARLAETIPHFHDTPYRMREFVRIAAEDPLGRGQRAQKEIYLILAGRAFADTFSRKMKQDALPVRVTHNDTKLSNILFRRDSLEPLAVIDLDTCMPGLVCYDFGDLVRSAARRTEQDGGFRLDPDRFRACAEGFLSETADFLTGAELDSLAPGAAVVTLELASRFLADYLNGDRYFRIEYPDHNLVRARRQLELYQDMSLRLEEMEEIIRAILR